MNKQEAIEMIERTTPGDEEEYDQPTDETRNRAKLFMSLMSDDMNFDVCSGPAGDIYIDIIKNGYELWFYFANDGEDGYSLINRNKKI